MKKWTWLPKAWSGSKLIFTYIGKLLQVPMEAKQVVAADAIKIE
tara:strand:+ start:300 stop:431 length:132 start_codon:yes stop_codon:yes gene_type:complete